MELYIYLADIPGWTADHPEAIRRLPKGFIYGWAMDQGAIAVRADSQE